MALFLIASMIVLITVGFPIAFAIGIPSLIYLLLTDPQFLLLLPQRMVAGVNSFPLMAIPFFILVGEIMNSGGLTDRLFNFARKIVGFIPGGLGHANVVASCMFASMSGSAVADTAGLGRVEMKAMSDAGYDKDFSIGITIASSTIGPIIPPSINMVIFGAISGASIGALFVGGIFPGLLIGLSMMVYIYITSRKRNYPVDPVPSLQELWDSFKGAVLALFTPLIIIGGILGGIFTPTEAAVTAVIYVFFISGVIYRELHIDNLYDIFVSTCTSTGAIMLIIAVASPFGYILTRERVPQMLAQILFSFSENYILFWLAILLFLLIVGMCMEVAAALIVLVPIFTPAINTLNMDLVHFGVVMCLTLGVGLITPPVGLCLYVGSNVSGLGLDRIIRDTAPYIIPIMIVIILCIAFPSIITFLPEIMSLR